jgi:hypothetical protein
MRRDLRYYIPWIASLIAEGADVERFLGPWVYELHHILDSDEGLVQSPGKILKIRVGRHLIFESGWNGLSGIQ